MLPLSLLRAAQGHPMLVELKNGETYNGHLDTCDTWMNINLTDVICTSRDGTRFWQMKECYIRGNTIKYLRIPDEVLEKVKEDVGSSSNTGKDKSIQGAGRGRGRGGYTPSSERGRGGHGGRGGGHSNERGGHRGGHSDRGGRGGGGGGRGGRGGGHGGRGGGGGGGGGHSSAASAAAGGD